MMVLASIYLSVSASLPSTANIKPVEWWLLFNLAYPLLVIMVNVVLQVCFIIYFSVNISLQGFEKKINEKRREETKTGRILNDNDKE